MTELAIAYNTNRILESNILRSGMLRSGTLGVLRSEVLYLGVLCSGMLRSRGVILGSGMLESSMRGSGNWKQYGETLNSDPL